MKFTAILLLLTLLACNRTEESTRSYDGWVVGVTDVNEFSKSHTYSNCKDIEDPVSKGIQRMIRCTDPRKHFEQITFFFSELDGKLAMLSVKYDSVPHSFESRIKLYNEQLEELKKDRSFQLMKVVTTRNELSLSQQEMDVYCHSRSCRQENYMNDVYFTQLFTQHTAAGHAVFAFTIHDINRLAQTTDLIDAREKTLVP